jgi:beta-galactosidase
VKSIVLKIGAYSKMQTIGIFVVATLMASILSVATVFAAPYVPDATNRVDLNFNQGWVFYLGNQNGAQAPAFNDASWTKVNLPHTVRLEPKISSGGNYQGIAWYRKSFPLDAAYSGRKVFIEFEAAMGTANLWINGTALPSHYGGYLPFTVDITPYAKFDGTANVIAVQVNNSDDPNTPPGKPQASLDFCYWGGIYRDAWMHITDKTHVTDAVYANTVAGGGIFVTYSNVSTSSATVQVKTNVKNENAASKTCSVKTTIVDSTNQVVATAATAAQAIAANADFTFTQTFTVTNPKLWHPNHPYLYTVYSSVNDGSAFVENYTTRIGIRTIKMVLGKNGFSINGEQLELFGANEHQEYLYIGYALSNSLQYRDVKKMRDDGMNFLRLSHYPHDPSFMDACDELGMLCDVPIPGWQYFGGTTFQQRSLQDVKDMVRRDRNHASIIIWEPNLNETFDQTTAFAQSCHNETHAEYPGDQCYTAGNAASSTAFELYDIAGHDCDGVKLFWTFEWSDNWSDGMTDTTGTRCARRYGEYDLYNSVLFKDPMFNSGTTQSPDWCGLGSAANTMGSSMWCFYDCNSALFNCLGGTGTMDADRYPKFDYWWFASQRDPSVVVPFANSGPVVKILSYWQQGSPSPVKIASNCQQVKMYLNNTLVATVNPPTATYPYVHHPLLSATITWASGTLRADGIINNAVVASDTVRTPLTANHIVLAIDTMGVAPVADGSDIFMVYAKVSDANGTIVPLPKTGPAVTLSISGEGTIVGNGDSRVGANPNTAEAGVAAFLIRTTQTAGTITMTATAGGLTAGTATIQTLPFNNGTTGIARPLNSAGLANAARVTERTFATVNGIVALPAECAGKHVAIAVYDLGGRLLFNGANDRRFREFSGKIRSVRGILIVKLLIQP